jgi:undecaprenyl pyrophosphate phosphatase UppP
MLALALTLILATVAYFLVTTLVDLFPFNNVRGARRSEQRTEVLTNLPLMALPAGLLGLAAALNLPALGYAAGGVELVAAVGGLILWWMPYLVGVTAPWATAGTGVTWHDLHARTYAHTVIVVPRIGDRPRPNLEHMVLHALFLAAAVCTFVVAPSLG